MKAKLTILEKSDQKVIEVCEKNKEPQYLYSGIISHCCKGYSPNQLIDIRKQLVDQLAHMKHADVPICYWGMFGEFIKGLESLGVAF
jgi:hypothetical protein